MAVIRCCKDCTKPRFVDGVRCHSWCEEYAKESAKNQKGLERLYKDNDYKAFKSGNVTKTLRRVQTHRYKCK